MSSVFQPARVLLAPADSVPLAVASRRWVLPLLILMGAVAFSGATYALKWDAGASVLRGLAVTGELARTTEQELATKITTASRVALVGGIAKGVLLMPLVVLLLAVGLKIAGWIVGRPIQFAASWSVMAVALLPTAVYHLIFGAVVLSSEVISEAQVKTLIPSHLGHLLKGLSPQMSRLASVADFFNLWGVALLGLGFSAATGMPKGRALLFAVVLYLAWAGVFLVGLPGMGGGAR